MSSRIESGTNEAAGSLPEGPGTDEESDVVSVELHCPLCGGLARRAWGRVCAFTFMAFVIFGVLTLASLPTRPGWRAIATLSWAALALLLLLALPITGAIAVASRPRCRSCGHRFWPATGAAGQVSTACFPVPLGVIGGAVLLTALGVGLALLFRVPGREIFNVSLTLFGRVIIAVFVYGVGLLAQAVLWRLLRARAMSAIGQAIVLLLPAVVLSAGWLALAMHDYGYFNRVNDTLVRAAGVLSQAGLAALPESARDVRVYTKRQPFTADLFLRFEADPEEIERFLADSPGIEGVKCRAYSKEKMRLATADQGETYQPPWVEGDEHFFRDADTPTWYDDEIRGAGRRYELRSQGGAWLGDLVVDDERHVVCVHQRK
ncbi:MAG: hypothetical protein JW741_12230 [Sedimentisphaerales bacterium]|nr:hypothetical protein [Sedimentisphaerales bacterium]